MEIPQALLGMGSTAHAAAVALPWFGDPDFPQGIYEVFKKGIHSFKHFIIMINLFLISFYRMGQS